MKFRQRGFLAVQFTRAKLFENPVEQTVERAAMRVGQFKIAKAIRRELLQVRREFVRDVKQQRRFADAARTDDGETLHLPRVRDFETRKDFLQLCAPSDELLWIDTTAVEEGIRHWDSPEG